jgi:hypothetical protein
MATHQYRPHRRAITKPHISSHAETTLTAAQTLAVDALATGCRDADAAERAGVCRETVTRWRLHHREFRTALQDRRRELWTASTDAMRALIPKALTAIGHALDSEDERTRTMAAFKLLSAVGPLPLTPPTAQDDALNDLIESRGSV